MKEAFKKTMRKRLWNIFKQYTDDDFGERGVDR